MAGDWQLQSRVPRSNVPFGGTANGILRTVDSAAQTHDLYGMEFKLQFIMGKVLSFKINLKGLIHSPVLKQRRKRGSRSILDQEKKTRKQLQRNWGPEVTLYMSLSGKLQNSWAGRQIFFQEFRQQAVWVKLSSMLKEQDTVAAMWVIND